MKDITVNSLQCYVGTWGYSTFPGATNKSIVAHLKKEVHELALEIESGLSAGIAEEAADCLLLLFHLAHRNNFSLIMEAEKKMKINECREWGPPDANGVREHVRKERPSMGAGRANCSPETGQPTSQSAQSCPRCGARLNRRGAKLFCDNLDCRWDQDAC